MEKITITEIMKCTVPSVIFFSTVLCPPFMKKLKRDESVGWSLAYSQKQAAQRSTKKGTTASASEDDAGNCFVICGPNFVYDRILRREGEMEAAEERKRCKRAFHFFLGTRVFEVVCKVAALKRPKFSKPNKRGPSTH